MLMIRCWLVSRVTRSTIYLIRHCQATGQAPEALLTQIGQQQAIALADWLCKFPIQRIVSSPFTRSRQSVQPLAEQLGVPIELDDRLVERVLSPIPLDDWQSHLAATFIDLELQVNGGESSQAAMRRGMAVIAAVMQNSRQPAAVVTHGNLMALLLKVFNPDIGFVEWRSLTYPDVYQLEQGCLPQRLVAGIVD